MQVESRSETYENVVNEKVLLEHESGWSSVSFTPLL